MRELLRHVSEALERGRELIVCQVVETRGSTPQKAGALMLVDPDGGQVGTLGGGCVEAEVKQKAIRRIGAEGAELHSFVLDHDYAWADGLICGGKMVILAEAVARPRSSGLLPGLSVPAGGRAGDDRGGRRRSREARRGRGGEPIPLRRRRHVRRGMAGARPARGPAAIGSRALDDRPKPAVRSGVAYLPTLPRVRLVIVGAGHVGQGVAKLAAEVDFDVWVVDDRQQYANAERFPTASRRIVGPIGEVLPALEMTPQTYAVIVTRGHGHDQEALEHLAATPAGYVGLIGSRRKIKLIFESLRERGMDESALARVAAPVGLDIGSQTVPEIAISIVAELIARRNLGPRSPAPRPNGEAARDAPAAKPARG